MRVSELEGKDIVAVDDGKKIGKIDELRIDPDQRSVTGVVVTKHGLLGKLNKKVIKYDGLQGIGGAAATIPSEEALDNIDHNKRLLTTPKASDLYRPVLTPTGDQVGTVEDFEFDPQSGMLTSVVMEPVEAYRSPNGGLLQIDMSRITTLSTGNVIVEVGALTPTLSDTPTEVGHPDTGVEDTRVDRRHR